MDTGGDWQRTVTLLEEHWRMASAMTAIVVLVAVLLVILAAWRG